MKPLKFPVRYYRLYPYPTASESFLGEAEEELTLKSNETALVVVHAWNFGYPGGPDLDPEQGYYMGWLEYIPRATKIINEAIKPAIDAARSVGIPIVHVVSGFQAHQYPQWRVIKELSSPEVSDFDDHELVSKEERELGSIEGGKWKLDYYERVWGKGYNEWWDRITAPDASPRVGIAPPVKPQPHDIVVTHGSQLNRILRGLGIWNLLYVGFATDLCLMLIPAALKEMSMRYDYRTIVLRDCTTTIEYPDTVDELLRTKLAIRLVESRMGYSTTSEAFITACRAAGDENL